VLLQPTELQLQREQFVSQDPSRADNGMDLVTVRSSRVEEFPGNVQLAAISQQSSVFPHVTIL
jgi:hypothetical protein